MVGHAVFLCLGAMCLGMAGFVSGLTWSARELGAAHDRAFGAGACAVFGALGLACLFIAGAVA